MVASPGRRAGGAARPRLPGGEPGRHPGPLERRRARARRADRRRPQRDRACRSRPAARTTGPSPARSLDRRSADRRRPSPPPEHAGHLVPGRARARATASPRGASMAGLPGIYMGQNNDVVWTFTNAIADVQDLFIERIEGDSYLFEGEWRPLEMRRRGDQGQGPRASRRCSGALHPPRPDRQRGPRRRRRRAAGAALDRAATSRPPTRRSSRSSTPAPARSWSARCGATRRRSRT